MSQRSVTVSTVGLVPAMGRLAEEGLAVTLAVSLHAPDDGLRDSLVPINTRWRVAEVLAAADAYAARTGRRYSIEYAMIRGSERSGLASRSARRPARRAAGPRQSHSAQPDARLGVGRLAETGRAGVRPPAVRTRGRSHGARYARSRDRRRVRPACRDRDLVDLDLPSSAQHIGEVDRLVSVCLGDRGVRDRPLVGVQTQGESRIVLQGASPAACSPVPARTAGSRWSARTSRCAAPLRACWRRSRTASRARRRSVDCGLSAGSPRSSRPGRSRRRRARSRASSGRQAHWRSASAPCAPGMSTAPITRSASSTARSTS